jgi:lysophospholipase L1-like esterase
MLRLVVVLGPGFVAAIVASAALLWPATDPGRVELSRPRPAASPTAVEDRSVTDDGLIHYVAIGDSITGTSVSASSGWAKQFAARLGAEAFTNLAENGWTTGQLLFAVQFHPEYRAALRTADVITLNAGMNEFFMGRDIYSKGECGGADGEACLRHMSTRFSLWYHALVAEIRALAPRADLLVLNLYHPLEAFDQHFGWAEAINRHIAAMNAIVAATPEGRLIDIHRAYNGPDGRGDPIALGYILPDAIHATAAGHDAIARLLDPAAISAIDRAPETGVQ